MPSNEPTQESHVSNLIRSCLFRTFGSTGHHAGFEDSALQVDAVVSQGFVDGGEDELGDLHGSDEVMISISTDIRLNNWNQSENTQRGVLLD